MEFAQLEQLLAKAKAYDQLQADYDALKVKCDEYEHTIAGIQSLLRIHQEDEPSPLPEPSPAVSKSRMSFALEEETPPPSPTKSTSSSGSIKRPPRTPHLSGRPFGTDQTHNPCINEDQSRIASENGIVFPKMIVKKGGKPQPNEFFPDKVWDYGIGKWMKKKSKHNPKYKCQLCAHHFDNGYCSFGNTCMFAHTQEELRPFTKYLYGSR